MITLKDHLLGKTIMKVNIAFDDLELAEAIEMIALVKAAHKGGPQETPAEKPKRHRRTKAEMVMPEKLTPTKYTYINM